MAQHRHQARRPRRQVGGRDHVGSRNGATYFASRSICRSRAGAKSFSSWSRAPTSGWKARSPAPIRKWNLDDATVWKVNPELVITHVSGFGQSGDPDYVHRASYDVVGQAVARHDVPDRLSRPDAADSRRAVDRRLHHRAVHDVVVARRTDLRARDRQGPVDRRRAVRSDSQDDGRHDGRIFSERHRARALRKSRAGLPAARLVPGERRMGRAGRARRRVRSGCCA